MQTSQRESKEQERRLIGMLLATLSISSMRDPVADKGVIRADNLWLIYSRKYLPNMKEGENVISLDEYKSMETL